MRLPKQYTGVNRTMSGMPQQSAGISASLSLQPFRSGFLQMFARLHCSTGPCVNGQKIRECFKPTYTYVPGSSGSPELGLPPGKGSWVFNGYEKVSTTYIPCVGGRSVLVNPPTKVVRTA